MQITPNIFYSATPATPRLEGDVVHPSGESVALSWLPLHGYQNKISILLPTLSMHIIDEKALPKLLMRLFRLCVLISSYLCGKSSKRYPCQIRP
jgi:hypothetical protein